MAVRKCWTACLCAMLAASVPAGSAAAEKTPAEPVRTKVLTGKERQTGKWADPQRVNDCKVPPDKRGDSTRPDDCSHVKQPAKTH